MILPHHAVSRHTFLAGLDVIAGPDGFYDILLAQIFDVRYLVSYLKDGAERSAYAPPSRPPTRVVACVLRLAAL